MLYGLLISSAAAKMILHYGVCLALILVAVLALGFSKRRTKKEVRFDFVKKQIEKSKACAEKLLATKHKVPILGSTKLLKLAASVEEATWYALQVVEIKKEMLFEGVANSLDSLATKLVNTASEGYVSLQDFEENVTEAIQTLDGAIEKVNAIIGR
jgi:hypothetical protein